MKKAYLVIGIIAFVTFLTGVPVLVTAIAEHGWGGANYGRVIFPLVISGIFLWLSRKA